jgi:hypothetical protein
LFLPSFRVYGSDVPEEQLFTKVSISKPRIAVNRLRTVRLIPKLLNSG